MPTLISHIVIAEKVYQELFSKRNKRDFYIGSTFPDIRVLKVIDREKTHFSDIKMSDLDFENDFLAGLKFHSIIDLSWRKYMIENKVYDLFPKSKYNELALKIIEEQLLYSKIENWGDYVRYFDDIIPEERQFDISDDNINKWHKILREHLAKEPTLQEQIKFLSLIEFSQQAIDNIKEEAILAINNKKIIKIIDGFYEKFDSQLYGK